MTGRRVCRASNTTNWWRSSRPDGEIRTGRVLEIDGDKALVQLFEGSQGLKISRRQGAVFGPRHGIGGVAQISWAGCLTAWAVPRTAGPPIIAEKCMDINGKPINPAARDYPDEFIQTGISAPSTG